jgi:hypothetical protein
MAVAFATLLRQAGLVVPVARVVAYAEALAVVGLGSRSGAYWAGRATLLSGPEQAAAYDAAFDAFWLGRPAVAPAEPVVEEVALAFDDEASEEQEPAASEEPRPQVMAVRYSAREALCHKDFAAYSSEEHAEARRLMADLRVAGSLRRSRRMTATRRRTGRPDVRRAVRAAVRSGGELGRLPRAAPSYRPRRIVLLCDVSGSMEAYARPLARFLHVAVAGRSRVEAFALGTRLTRITRELSTRDPDAALSAAAMAVADWSGGTRLGEGLRRFNDGWGMRGTARGAVVVILSDGWDRGDPALLAEQLGRLRRVAHRIVWVNPLKATPGYVPLARGMAAALPFVDEFVEGHSLASLEALAHLLAGRFPRTPTVGIRQLVCAEAGA